MFAYLLSNAGTVVPVVCVLAIVLVAKCALILSTIVALVHPKKDRRQEARLIMKDHLNAKPFVIKLPGKKDTG